MRTVHALDASGQWEVCMLIGETGCLSVSLRHISRDWQWDEKTAEGGGPHLHKTHAGHTLSLSLGSVRGFGGEGCDGNRLSFLERIPNWQIGGGVLRSNCGDSWIKINFPWHLHSGRTALGLRLSTGLKALWGQGRRDAPPLRVSLFLSPAWTERDRALTFHLREAWGQRSLVITSLSLCISKTVNEHRGVTHHPALLLSQESALIWSTHTRHFILHDAKWLECSFSRYAYFDLIYLSYHMKNLYFWCGSHFHLTNLGNKNTKISNCRPISHVNDTAFLQRINTIE